MDGRERSSPDYIHLGIMAQSFGWLHNSVDFVFLAVEQAGAPWWSLNAIQAWYVAIVLEHPTRFF